MKNKEDGRRGNHDGKARKLGRKRKVLLRKKELKTGMYIENDLSRKEREIQRKIRELHGKRERRERES